MTDAMKEPYVFTTTDPSKATAEDWAQHERNRRSDARVKASLFGLLMGVVGLVLGGGLFSILGIGLGTGLCLYSVIRGMDAQYVRRWKLPGLIDTPK